MKLPRPLPTAAIFACLLAGCAAPENNAVFVTRTSLGVDVDSTPTTAAFGYNRAEGYLGPRYDSGTIPGVAGAFHTNGGLFNRKIRQAYATGAAAKNATAADGTTAEAEDERFQGDRKAMFFGTSTIVGVNMAFGDAQAATAFTLGMKRKEVSIIPVSGTTGAVFPSVFGRFDNTAEAKIEGNDALTIHQFFATGIPAQRLAAQDSVRQEFRSEAKGDFKSTYRDEEHRQSLLARGAVLCVTKVNDADLPKVWANAEALSLFPDQQAIADIRNAGGPQAQRGEYVYYVGLLHPAEREHTTLLDLHAKFVCDLPGAKT